MIEREYHPFRRWLVLYLPGLIGADSKDKELAQLWNSLFKIQPAWYRPVVDQLSPEFGAVLERLAEVSRTLARSVHLEDKLVPPAGYLENLRDRLVEAYLQRHQLSSEQLNAEAELSDQQRERLLERVNSLPQGEAAEWDRALIGLDALLHLICHPWSQLEGLFPKKAQRSPQRGLKFVDRLLDLYYVSEPVRVNPMLELVLKEGFAAASVDSLKQLRAGLIELNGDKRFQDLIRGILAEPTFPTKVARYKPPGFSEALREFTGSFLAETRRKDRLEQRKNLAQKVKNVFGNFELAEFPQYNQKYSDFLVGKRLPELLHVDALQILATLQKGFDPMLRELFQGFQLEVDFVSEARRQEFHNTLDNYYRLMGSLDTLAQEFKSPSASTLAPVQALIDRQFIDTRVHESAPNAVNHANDRVDVICRQGLRTLTELQARLLAYQEDATESVPRYYSGANALRRRFPTMFDKLDRSVKMLAKVNEVLGLVVVLED